MDIKLSQTQISSIKHIMGQAGWDNLMELVDKVSDNYSKEPVKADTEFQTLWNTAQREAKVQSLKDFFKMVEDYIIK